jgi:hypothetical protein
VVHRCHPVALRPPSDRGHAFSADVEGYVARHVTARPYLDANYVSGLAKMSTEAATEKHATQQDTAVVFQRQSALNAQSVVTRVDKRKTISNEVFQAQRDELEGKVFELFNEVPNWTTQEIAVGCASLGSVSSAVASELLVQGGMRGLPLLMHRAWLQKQLKITVTQATSLLARIAIKVQAGPMRGRWGLKAEYRQDYGQEPHAMDQ